MNRRIKQITVLLFASMFINSTHTSEVPQSKKAKMGRKRSGKRFRFSFTNKSLIELIDELAAEKNINYILPQGARAIPANTTVTYHLPELISINEAWKQLNAILEVAGYTMKPEGNIIAIKKIDSNINRQPFEPIYIDEPLENIPDTEQIIRTIFYLKNLSIKVSGSNLNDILKGTPSSPGMLSTTADVRSDSKTNSILLTDKACNIKSAMKIIHELDRGGMRDSIEVLPLHYISADTLDTLFNQKLFAPKSQTPGTPSTTPEQVSYFPKNTKVKGLSRTNSLVIMGTPYAIDLVKDFILKYLDRPLESGESILHVYELQYLDAETFASKLESMVSPEKSEQSTGKVLIGVKQYFKDVIVQAEKVSTTKEIKPTTPEGYEATPGIAQPSTEGAQRGGNRLIIAAHKKDWIRIEKLLKELDKPQPQVALEVLIVDISLNNNKLLGHQMRNKEGLDGNTSNDINFQTAHLSEPILKNSVSDGFTDELGNQIESRPGDALMANLLQLGDPFNADKNLANTKFPGSLILSLKDNQESGVWSVWQLLNNYTDSTILAQPFIITKNHKQASITIAQQRFLEGAADTTNVAVNVPREWVTAALAVDILPHISATGNINLQITVNISEFESEKADNRITRVVQTNANIGNNQILALGGLTRTSGNIDKTETPILGKIPLIGWFFKKQEKTKAKNNLAIFICPTIIEPKALGGIDHYTSRKLDLAKNNLEDHLSFENLRDPITRWFFKPDPCFAEKTIEDYNKKTVEEIYNDSTTPKPQQPTRTSNLAPLGITQKETEQLKTLVQNEENPLNSPESKKQADLQ